MKNVMRIFRRDVKRLSRNLAALLVVGGVCLLPSLYAWFNIAANMDPYGNTQGIRVAVANCDAGAEEDAMSLDAGAAIVENLKENDKLGWEFVSEEDALEGVKSGDYYAAIVIPEDFSESLLSILSGNVEQPQLDYYINEKKNAIAPKITDTGATTIQQQINDTFSAVASESISEMVIASASDLTIDLDSANGELLSSIQKVRDNLSEYQELLNDFDETVASTDELIADTGKTLDKVKSSAAAASDTLEVTDNLLERSRTAASEFSGSFSENLSDGGLFLNDAYVTASIRLGVFETKIGQVNEQVSASIEKASNLNKKNAEILQALSDLQQELGSDSGFSQTVAGQITQLQQQNAAFSQLWSSLDNSSSGLDESITNAANARTEMESAVKDGKADLQETADAISGKVLLQISQALDRTASAGGSLSAVLAQITPTANQLELMLGQLQTSLDDSLDTLNRMGSALEKVDRQLSDIATDVRALQSSETYEELLALEGMNAEAISDFMESPVSINSEVWYDVENYGSGMTPFYTNLALWVGGLILVNILKQEVDKDETVSDFSSTSAYFGRWLLFEVLGVIQGFIVCVGDLVLLGTQCLHPVLFVATGVFCSFVYVNLIYALALAFKHIGKALAVLLVILQIPGSSGTYPIEMMPDFFQNLNPFLPFTYSIRAMRECVAGFYEMTYVKNMAILLVYVAVAFFIGLVLRPILMNINHLFDRKLAETELMVGETESEERQQPQLQILLQALLQNDVTKRGFMEKSGKFEARYPLMVRFGFALILIVPLAFLILSFSLETKLVFLVLWILSLIALALYLFCVEYIHDRITRQLEIAGLTVDELMEKLQGGQKK